MKVPFSPPDVGQAEAQAVAEVITSGWITTGPRTKEFERRLASEYFGTFKVVCLNSATAALECALRLLGIGPGDEVIVPAYTYTASCSPIVHVGATPVLVDILPDSFLIDPAAVGAALTERTKAVIPVDIAGIPCDYQGLWDVLDAHKDLYHPATELQERFDRVPIVADCAHALGASYKGTPVGSVADFSTFSFHAAKNLVTAEGGALTWRSFGPKTNEDLYRQAQLLSLHGQSKDALAKDKAGSWEYDIKFLGYKWNMPDITAALGLAQLDRYPQMLARRREVFDAYVEGLSQLPVEFVYHPSLAAGDDSQSSMHLCLVNLTGKDEDFRNKLITAMGKAGVATNVHYKPLPLFTGYQDLGFKMEDYPRSYERYSTVMTLPLYSKLTDEEVAFVIDTFIDCYNSLN